VGKKKNKGQPHQTQSFEQLVGQANRNALKPYINQLFGSLANDLSQRLFTRMAIFQNRIEALESILKMKLNVTQEEMDTALFDLEDKVTGYQKVDRPAQEGDLLRLTMRVKNTEKGYGKPTKKEFSNLGREPFALGVPFIEKALLGVSVGVPTVVPFDEELRKQTKTDEVEFTIDRISELIEKPVVKKEEPQNAEGQNASQPAGSEVPEQTGQA
jgi:hypothetical protein